MSGLLSLPWVPRIPEPDVLLVALAAKGTVTLLVGVVLCTLMARSSAGARHLVWTATLAGLLMLPLLALVVPPVGVSLLPPAAQAAAGQAPAASVAVASGPPRATGETRPEALPRRDESAPLRLLTAVYIAGVLASLAYFAAGWLAARRLTRAAAPAPSLVRSAALAAARLAAPPALLISGRLPAPFTWGLWRPKVLLPAAARDWRPGELRRALVHELAHVERRDWAAQLVGHLACALWWFHPLAWLAARRQALEAERACDDRVLASGAGSHEYARQLVGLTRLQRASALWQPTTVPLARPSQLQLRVRSILDPRLRRPSMRPIARTLSLVLAALPALLIAPLHLAPAAAEEPPSVAAELLVTAAARGDLEAVRLLLDAGLDPDLAAPGDGNAMIQAAARGDTELLRLLLERGADVDASVRGDGSPLIAAARAGRLAAVRLLLDSGADVDRAVPGDENALIQAAGAGRVEVVRYLIEHGADVDARVVADLGEARTPLSMANRNGHGEVAGLLRAAGAQE